MAVTVIVRSGARVPDRQDSDAALAITLDAPLVVLGRGDSCDVRLPDPSVSHRHATIRQRGNEYFLVDERSSNGTFVGSARLGAQAPRLLKHGDLARLGRVWIEVRFDRPASTVSSALATKELALLLVARALEAQGEASGPRLRVTDGPDQGRTMRIEDSGRSYVLGRGQDVDFVMADPDASRRHLQVVRRAEQLLVRDLGSKNGSELAGVRLPTDRDCPWRPGQAVKFGSSIVVYEHAAASALAELEREADERMHGDEEVPGPNPTSADPSDFDPNREAASSGPIGNQQAMADSTTAKRADGPDSDSPTGAGPMQGNGSASTAPVARVEPQRRLGAFVRAGSHGTWSGTDLLVLLLAVSVLALSVIGLLWLFKG